MTEPFQQSGTAQIEFWNGERKIATTKHYSVYHLYKLVPDGDQMRAEWRLWPGMKTLSVLHFRKLTMEPPILFEHLSGVGLMGFLDHCEIRVPSELATNLNDKDLRYVHGRSEVMRGNPLISAVVLARVGKADDYNELRFKTQLPDIYRALLDQMTGKIESP